MPLSRISTGVVFVGAGPAGLAPLFAAACAGSLRDLLGRGITILERGGRLGGGALSLYAIGSDSTAESFLDIITRSTEPSLRALRWHPVVQQLASLGKGAAPLALVAEFLELAGNVLCGLVAASPRGSVLCGAEVVTVRRTASGHWRTRYRQTGSPAILEVDSMAVVLATGASQPADRLHTECVAGEPLLPRFAHNLLQSGDVLAHDGLEQVAKRLSGKPRPRVVIVGGSTSAGATAARLLRPSSPVRFGDGDLVLMHRKPLRIFYDSVADALRDGYDEFCDEDVCSLTGRVYRYSGFRLDSRELIMAVLGIGNRPEEHRLQLLRLTPDRELEAQQRLAEADLIVAALGYRPKMVPIHAEDGHELALANPRSPLWSTVDANCQLQTEQGTSLLNLYAIGLAVGPAPTPDLGGELHFQGQVNSLWMWQHMLGMRIVEGLLKAVPQPETPWASIARGDLREISHHGHMTPASPLDTAAAAAVGAAL